jgi:hypothetical protein
MRRARPGANAGRIAANAQAGSEIAANAATV